MSLLINLRQLENSPLQLQGQIAPADLGIDFEDEVIHLRHPLTYDIEVQQLDDCILARGRVDLVLDCECVHCLKPFQHLLTLPSWACHLPLTGEDKVPVKSDHVDLTPSLREDILLEFPQHPLCKPECGGLPKKAASKKKNTVSGKTVELSSAWAELNKLKF